MVTSHQITAIESRSLPEIKRIRAFSILIKGLIRSSKERLIQGVEIVKRSTVTTWNQISPLFIVFYVIKPKGGGGMIVRPNALIFDPPHHWGIISLSPPPPLLLPPSCLLLLQWSYFNIISKAILHLVYCCTTNAILLHISYCRDKTTIHSPLNNVYSDSVQSSICVQSKSNKNIQQQHSFLLQLSNMQTKQQ